MTKQQIKKLNNNQGFLVVTPKRPIDIIKPPKLPRPKQPTLREIMLDIQKNIKELQQGRKTVNKQFKAHGGTK